MAELRKTGRPPEIGPPKRQCFRGIRGDRIVNLMEQYQPPRFVPFREVLRVVRKAAARDHEGRCASVSRPL
jgi:hypothetical protein